MTSFEEELTDLLDARAERVNVRPEPEAAEGPVVLEKVTSGAVVTPMGERSGARNWLFAAAAGLVLVLGIFGLTRGSGDPVADVDLAVEFDGAAADYSVIPLGTDVDFVVWMQVEATQDEVDSVDDWIDASPLIESWHYVTRAETYVEFQEHWADAPEILAAVAPEDLPTSFRVSVVEGLDADVVVALIDEVLLLRGVRDVQQATDDGDVLVGPVPRAAPLFVLPPDEFLSSPLEGMEPSPSEEPAIETLVVGRRTDTGFTDLVVVERTVERGFLATTPIEIGGRSVDPDIDQDGLVAEQLDDGTWLRFTSWRNPDFLEIVVPATIVVDGGIAFAANDSADTAGVDTVGFEVLSWSTPGAYVNTSIVVLGDFGPQMILLTSAFEPGAEPLLSIARNDGDAERFSNDDIAGYFLRPSSSTFIGDLNAFAWRITEDHVATISMLGTDEEVLAAAAGVRIVDQATWQAAIDGELAVDATAGLGPLFLLPPEDVPLEDVPLDGLEGVVIESDDQTSPDASAVAVGRQTATGFDRLMAVALLDEREFTNSEAQVVEGRQILVDADGPGVAAEQLDDGRWLHFYVNDLDVELISLVRSASVIDGEIVFEPFDDVVELERVNDLLPAGTTVSAFPSLGSEAAFGVSTSPGRDGFGLIAFAAEFDEVIAVEIRGQPGFQVFGDVATGPGEAVAWIEPSGHQIYVSTSGTGSVLDLAESLVVVDEATWRAAIPEPRDFN